MNISRVEEGDKHYGSHFAKYLVDILARCATNRQLAGEHVRRDWARLCALVFAVSGIRMPDKPPTEDQARLWRLSRLPRILEGDGTQIRPELATFLTEVTKLGRAPTPSTSTTRRCGRPAS